LENDKSWRTDSYQEGKYTVSVRANLENDRVDEGDCPNGGSNSMYEEKTKPKNNE